MSRIRVVHYLVTPMCMVDDGENLTPLVLNQVAFEAAEWPNAQERVAEFVAAEQAKLDEATGE